MKGISKAVVKISKVLDRIAGFFYLAMLILVTCNVIMRKIFRFPILGTVELVEIFAAVAVGLAIAYCAVQNGHITIEFVMDYFPKWFKRIAGVIVNTISIAFLGLSAWMVFQYGNTIKETKRVTGSLDIAYYPFVYLIAIGFGIYALVTFIKIFVPDMNKEVE